MTTDSSLPQTSTLSVGSLVCMILPATLHDGHFVCKNMTMMCVSRLTAVTPTLLACQSFPFLRGHVTPTISTTDVRFKSDRRHADTVCLSKLPLPWRACDADNFGNCLAALDTPFLYFATFCAEKRKDHSLASFFSSAVEKLRQSTFVIQDDILHR